MVRSGLIWLQKWDQWRTLVKAAVSSQFPSYSVDSVSTKRQKSVISVMKIMAECSTDKVEGRYLRQAGYINRRCN
jgi:hypothetical protein